MHKYRTLFFLILSFGITATMEETDRNVVVWYPIPIKLMALKQNLNDTESPPLFSHTLISYLKKLVYVQKTDADEQVDVVSRNDNNKEDPEKCNNHTGKLNSISPQIPEYIKTANNFFYVRNASYEVMDFPSDDREIDGESSKYNIAGGNKDAVVTTTYLGLLDENVNNQSGNDEDGSLVVTTTSDAAIQEEDPLKSPNVEDLLSNRYANSENSSTEGSNREANENRNDTKVITLKIIVVNEASDSALDQPNGSLESSEDAVATRLFNILSTPSFEAVTETNIDEEVRFLQNTKLEPNDTLKERVLEENYSLNNSENPSLNQTNEKSKVKNKTRVNIRYTLTNPDEYDEETFNSLVEELLRNDSSIIEINTESHKRDILETNSRDSTEINSNNAELTVEGSNKNELINENSTTNEKEYHETNEETKEIAETYEGKTQVSETTETTEKETEASTKTYEQQTAATIAVRSGISDEQNNKEEVPVGKNVTNIHPTDYSGSNGSFRALYSSASKKNIEIGNNDKSSALIKRYLLELNRTRSSSNSRLNKTELDQITSTPDETTCKCMHRVLKVLLHDFIKKTANFEEASSRATPEGSKSIEQHER